MDQQDYKILYEDAIEKLEQQYTWQRRYQDERIRSDVYRELLEMVLRV